MAQRRNADRGRVDARGGEMAVEHDDYRERRARREGVRRNVSRVVVALVLAFAMLGWGVSAAHAQETTPGADSASVTAGATPDADSTARAESLGMVNPRHMWQQGADEESATGSNDADGAVGGARSLARDRTPSWGTSSSGKVFYDGNGAVYLKNASKVVDVSEFQGDIDWAKVAASDVDAVILRAGWGDGGVDQKFARNLAGVRKYHIPFGVYWYSYAYDAGFAATEATSLVNVLKANGVTPSHLSLPVYLDLEEFAEWSGHKPPTTPAAYERIMNAFLGKLNQSGYTNNAVYSYVTYLTGRLRSDAIWKHVNWVAVYGPIGPQAWVSVPGRTMNWQYTSEGYVNGINNANGTDLSAFNHVGPAPIGDFADVFESTPHATDILWLAKQGIAQGYDNADGTVTFGGMRTVVRQDMAAFLYRLAGSPEFDEAAAAKANKFVDVNSKTPHYKEILWLASTGIAKGYTTRNAKTGKTTVAFGGMRTVVRQDMAAFLKRFADWGQVNAKLGATKTFKDVNSKTPHAGEISWLARTGVAKGYGDGTFGGMRSVVRQDMAAFLHRMNANVLNWYAN